MCQPQFLQVLLQRAYVLPSSSSLLNQSFHIINLLLQSVIHHTATRIVAPLALYLRNLTVRVHKRLQRIQILPQQLHLLRSPLLFCLEQHIAHVHDLRLNRVALSRSRGMAFRDPGAYVGNKSVKFAIVCVGSWRFSS